MSALRAGVAALTVVTLSPALASCGGDQAPARTNVVTVLAAASLTEAFGDLEKQVEAANPTIDVRVSYAASSTIVQQVNNRADADVMALADEKSAQKLVGYRGVVPSVFATNQLSIATPPSNPGGVKTLADLGSPTVDTVLCAAQVPCGRAASTVLDRASVKPKVVSYEQDVKATLAKVRLGEADAAIVYATDVKAAGTAVHGVAIPAAQNVTTRLPVYPLTSRQGTKAFVAALMSPAGQKVLQTRGFGAP